MADLSHIEALTFDVFGTVVDWRGSIIRDGMLLGAELGLSRDWNAFALAWRSGYAPAMAKVGGGELPWLKIDHLHRMILDEILPQFDLGDLSEARRVWFNKVWHRLTPWPDTVEGLTRLKCEYIIATLSNGNFSLLTRMAKYGGLPWDCILSAELAKHYKQDPEAYTVSADLLSLDPEQIMMVAAHPGDLRRARAVGFRTAYVDRPEEYGSFQEPVPYDPDEFDLVASNFVHLADLMDC